MSEPAGNSFKQNMKEVTKQRRESRIRYLSAFRCLIASFFKLEYNLNLKRAIMLLPLVLESYLVCCKYEFVEPDFPSKFINVASKTVFPLFLLLYGLMLLSNNCKN